MQYRQDEPKPDKIHESKGLFIPIEILNDKNLSHGEKILLSQIYWYDQFTECHASNKHLANLMNMNIRGLQKMIKKLKDKKYLNSNDLYNRVLRLNHVQMDTPPCPNGHGNHVQMDTPIKKNIKKIIKKNIYCEDAKKVLDYLNSIHNRNFRDTTHIKTRLKQGYSVDDCKKVIDNKKADPYFIENPQYLRPTTLFCPKHFDEYLNEIPKKKKYNRELYQYDSAYRRKVDENRDKYY